MIQLEQEEFFNVFELLPQNSQDTYFQKLQSGVLKTAVTSCADETCERDVQTEDLGREDKQQQAPDDKMIDDYSVGKSANAAAPTSAGGTVTI